jgi:hypothetical protein
VDHAKLAARLRRGFAGRLPESHRSGRQAKTEREWAERAARHLKPELKRVDLTYEELPDRLKKHGFKETKALGQPTEPTISGTASEDDDEAAN